MFLKSIDMFLNCSWIFIAKIADHHANAVIIVGLVMLPPRQWPWGCQVADKKLGFSFMKKM